MVAATARLLIVLGALALASTALAADPKEPQKHHSAADMRLAASIALHRGDLAAGWKKVKSDSSSGTCAAAPDESSLVETADVDPTFDSPGGGTVTVDSEVQLFATAKQAAADWRSGTAKLLRACAEQELKKEFGPTAKVALAQVAAPKLGGVRTKSFRMVVDAHYQGKHVVVQSDVIALISGRAEVLLTGTALKGALDPAALRPLAGVLAKRLRAAHV